MNTSTHPAAMPGAEIGMITRQSVEIGRARQVAAWPGVEDPPEARAQWHPRARMLEVGPGRRAVDVADEGVELAGEFGERLGVAVRGEERTGVPLVLVMPGEIQTRRVRRAVEPLDDHEATRPEHPPRVPQERGYSKWPLHLAAVS